MKAQLVLALSAASIVLASLLGNGCSPTGGDFPPLATGGTAGGDESGGSHGNGGDPGSGGALAGSGGAKGVGGSPGRGLGGQSAGGNSSVPSTGGLLSATGGRTGFGFPTVDAGMKADAPTFPRDAAPLTQQDASKRDSMGVTPRDATVTRDLAPLRRD